MRFKTVLVLFVVFGHARAFAASCELTPSLQKKAHQAMLDLGLTGVDDENRFVTWQLTRTVALPLDPSKCLLVMNNCGRFNMDDVPDCASSAIREVLAMDSSGKIGRFESVVHVPAKIRVGIAQQLGKSFYAELDGASAIDAWKAILSQTPYWGINGYPANNGKLSFDPTPGRTWKLEKVTYSLRRGLTGEALDVYAHEFDDDFEGTNRGCGGQVASWGGWVNSYFDEAKAEWIGVPVDEQLKLPGNLGLSAPSQGGSPGIE